MAGTSYPGSTSLDPALGWDQAGDFVGNANGSGLPWNQWTAGTGGGEPDWHDPFEFLAAGGAATAAGGGGTKPAATSYVGESEADRTSYGADWFETIHIIPHAKIEFGNIITQETENYEIFNAYRDTTVTLSAIVNNISPGITLPNLTPPAAKGPLGSWLDTTSTGNGGGTGLGTLVQLAVIAEEEGLPKFDGTVVFSFDTADEVALEASGQRLVLIPFEYESPTFETLAFLTDIIEALNGKEQRIALRSNPRQIFEVTYRLSLNDRQRMQALLMDWMGNSFGFPLWHEQLRLTSAVSAGGTAYTVSTTSEVDLRDGGLALVFTDANTFDVINITALTATTITANDPAVNSYPVGTKIMPLRTATLLRAVSGRRHPNNLEEFVCTFEVTDNSTGALTGSTTPGVWSTYNSRVLFDDCNVVNATMEERFEQRVHRIDNETGITSQVSTWDRNKRNLQKGYVAHSRAEILSFRRLLLALEGKVVSFYMPTFISDLTAGDDLASGAATMDVDRIEYSRFVAERNDKAVFRITFTDGTSLVRGILSSADHPSDGTLERLTLDDTWPANRTVAEISRIEFYELVRFDTDNFRLEYPRIGQMKMFAPVKQVFDDN